MLNDGLLMRTPAYQPLESPLHYILRLSEKNGYRSPNVVLRLATLHADWRVRATWDYAHLNKLLPTCRHAPPTFTYRWPTSKHRCDLSLLGRPILSRHLNAVHAGVCPACVQQLNFAPAWWDLRYAIACPAHHRMLVFRCSRCGKGVSFLRRGLLVCSCGANLDVEVEEQPSAALLWLMGLLQYKAEGSLSDADPETKPTPPLRPEEASLDTLCTIIETIGRADQRMTANGTSRSAESRRLCLPAVASFLHDWPHGVSPFCARWREYMMSTHGPHRNLRSAFAWAFQGLFKNRHEERADTLFIIDAVLQYVASSLPGRAVDIRAHDLRRLPQDKRTYCGITRAAEISGIPRYTLLRMIRRKQITCRVSNRGTRVIYEIETDAARNLRVAYEPALMYRDGSRYLGVTHNIYRDLRMDGVLKKAHETMHPEAMAICDLEDFKRRVLERARQVTSIAEMKSLDQLRVGGCPRAAMAQIIKGILRGAIQLFHAGAAPQRINDLFVRMVDVDPIIASCRAKKPPTQQELQVPSPRRCRSLRLHARERAFPTRVGLQGPVRHKLSCKGRRI